MWSGIGGKGLVARASCRSISRGIELTTLGWEQRSEGTFFSALSGMLEYESLQETVL